MVRLRSSELNIFCPILEVVDPYKLDDTTIGPIPIVFDYLILHILFLPCIENWFQFVYCRCIRHVVMFRTCHYMYDY